MISFNHFALRKAKTLWSFGLSECNRVNEPIRGPPILVKNCVFLLSIHVHRVQFS